MIQRVLRELHIWSKISHENIVELLLIEMNEKDNSITLVSKKMDGNVRQALKDVPNEGPIDHIRVVSPLPFQYEAGIMILLARSKA